MELSREDRLRLLRFVCNAAWGDLEVQKEERAHVITLAERLGLDEDDMEHVHRWLKSPPPIDSVDPTSIPEELRVLYLHEMEALFKADHVTTEEESDLLTLMRELLSP